jgi:DNA-binding SARP family transcriptional activator
MLVFLALGPMEIRTSIRTARFRGTMLQTLLATFLAAGGKLVTADSLTEELWGMAPPAKADNALQAQISRLRKMLARLEPDRTEPRLITSAAGYQFAIGQTEFDALSFLHTISAIRAKSGDDDPRQTVRDLRDALALWRGPVFGGLTGGPVCQTAKARYEESRTAALELLYDRELELGRHAAIIPELTELVAQHPANEQFCSLLMVALYRSGRQTDALEIYRQLKHHLIEELGIEPSPVLNRYEAAILNHDPLMMSPERRPGVHRGHQHEAIRIGRPRTLSRGGLKRLKR